MSHIRDTSRVTPDVDTGSTTPTPSISATEDRAAYIAALGFPILVIIGGIVGFTASDAVSTISGWTNTLLGIVMFGMGLTLRPVDFALVARRPLPVAIGVVAQYVLMPLIALLVVWILQLPPEIAAGVILVGCAPGGTSSNVVSYLARGDVALSVTMTSVSTLLAPLLTPLLTLWLAGRYMPLDAGSMALSIVQVVLVPVIAGLLIRLLLPRVVEAVLPVLPWVSVVAIAMIVAIVVSGSRDVIVEAGLIVLVAVIIHNALGYLLGYLAGRFTGQPVPARRTMAVEVGMQNSGLAAGLATQYMSPLAALPGAVFSVWHNLSGAVVAALCRAADRPRR
ncbi:bile acid:sodium symporter family protein [Corynebacterium halotolerans]|uniref:Na+-dependent transporter n=1 Tax=Corynebacterium halotolerans YIM 70093 = DSM 44683 TaxID=1121362 RepID=M1NLJ7_9CORY|nr:bile acid:sodium symporter family protein [Corynebacterium halotolerans]AGF72283.1 Na+-dependent transporter [Corynebacterium halotolerans YIM 70093 = DSM 44683]